MKIIETVEELKKDRHDLVELFEGMDREQLLNQIYLEVLDGINMETRVAKFMSLCTINMSKTTYTLNSIEDLVSDWENELIRQHSEWEEN